MSNWFTNLFAPGKAPNLSSDTANNGLQSIAASPSNSGTSGTSGISGTSGSSGKSGSSGSSGSSGKDGRDGKDGEISGSVSVTEQLFNPNSFGAKPNDISFSTKNTNAFRLCQSKYGKIDIGPGEYFFSNDIRVASDLKVNGAGIDTTVLSTLPNNPVIEERGKNGEWYSLFNTNTAQSTRIGDVYGVPFGDSNNVEIKNLTINGNYNKQKTDSQSRFYTTIQSIFLQGSNNKVKNVKSIGCARGLGGGECFQIRLTFGPNTVGSKGGEVTGCEVTDVGYCGATHNGGGGYEISCITVSGYKDKLAYGVKVANNIVRGIPIISGKQNSSINALCCSGAESPIICDNLVEKVDGSGFYVDSWYSNGMLIKNNYFNKVWRGIFLNAYGDSSNPVSLKMDNLIIKGNDINLVSETPKETKVNSPFIGIMVNSPTYLEYGLFSNLSIYQNTIKGFGGIMGTAFPEPFFSRGIYFVINHKNQYSNVKVTQNIIDTPDMKQGSPYYPDSGCLSLYFYGTNDTLTSEIVVSENKNSNGKLLKGMHCKPDFTWNKWF